MAGLETRKRWLALGVVLMLEAAVGNAGPLDRGPMQQRNNPATENMLRVPGVVGLYLDEAMAVLQQAGLAVRLVRIMDEDPRYRNREGRVVHQEPGPGGVAMVGATVVITVYKALPANPEEAPERWGEEINTGIGSGMDSGIDTGGWIPPGSEEGTIYDDQ